LLSDIRLTSISYVHANQKVTEKSTQSHYYAEDFEFVAQINDNTVILPSRKEIIPAANVRKTLCEIDGHIMKLVNGDTIENVEVSVSGSNITSGSVSIWEQY
jgi:hypothetical protein